MLMNNTVLVFAFAGSICSLLVGTIVYHLFVRFSHLVGLSDDWPSLFSFLVVTVCLILWCIFAGPLFGPVCSNGHKNDMTADFCIVCGEEFEPSCDCGYRWQDEAFCPKCGNAHVE